MYSVFLSSTWWRTDSDDGYVSGGAQVPFEGLEFQSFIKVTEEK
jgi:hypothetical protein